MFRKSLYKLDLNSRCRIWTIEVEKNAYRTISGLVDGAQGISEWSFVTGKNKGRANATTDEEQAMRVAETLIRIRKEQGCSEHIEDASKGKSWFQPMLASRWDNLRDRVVVDKQHPIYLEHKLDGSRCIATKDLLQTRTGKEWVATPHILEKLKPVFEKYPDLILDGELYSHSSEDNFQEIISIIKKTKPTEEDLKKSKEYIQYWIYDVPSMHANFKERYNFMLKLFEDFPDVFDNSFVLVKAFEVTDKSVVKDYLERFVSEGFEGAIIRLDKPYECKRSKYLMKYKQFNDEEFPIVRIEEGRGNLAGKAGRVVVDVDGVEVAAGLKFSHDQAVEIWNNRDNLVGKLATIKYFGDKTPDGSLRFPKCIDIDRDY